MQIARPVGRQAASRKYDLLTALGVHACHGDKHLQRLVLRLMTLIVARYNWQSDEITVGQREIAALWGVDERTVKRDIARLRALGWLVQHRAAVRGRVASHGLDLKAILAATRGDWAAVGPDFVDRMAGPEAPATPAPNVVSFPGSAPPLPKDAGLWARAQARLHAEDPALFAAWFRPLVELGAEGGLLELAAPSRFHASYVTTHLTARVLAALRAEDGTIRAVRLTGD
ncbi:MAG: hypothetical protein CFE34_13890 [Rhodobacteraceae bacterium PARR1]|nr:MAG: hypothetical protein CFE34_13890 [Rhodobacteraceae bacterium PARR1]